MFKNEYVIVRHTATRIFAVACVVLLLQACSGGSCSRSGDTSPGAAEVEKAEAQRADMILAEPVAFDQQSVADALRELSKEGNLTAAETARIIMSAEAAIDHLNAMLESLLRNGDNADSWHIITEISEAGWAEQATRIVRILSSMQLNEAEYRHVDGIRHAMARTDVLLTSLYREVPSLPRLNVSLSPEDE